MLFILKMIYAYVLYEYVEIRAKKPKRLGVRHKGGGLFGVDGGDAHAALDVFLLVAEAQEHVPGGHLAKPVGWGKRLGNAG